MDEQIGVYSHNGYIPQQTVDTNTWMNLKNIVSIKEAIRNRVDLQDLFICSSRTDEANLW